MLSHAITVHFYLNKKSIRFFLDHSFNIEEKYHYSQSPVPPLQMSSFVHREVKNLKTISLVVMVLKVSCHTKPVSTSTFVWSLSEFFHPPTEHPWSTAALCHPKISSVPYFRVKLLNFWTFPYWTVDSFLNGSPRHTAPVSTCFCFAVLYLFWLTETQFVMLDRKGAVYCSVQMNFWQQSDCRGYWVHAIKPCGKYSMWVQPITDAVSHLTHPNNSWTLIKHPENHLKVFQRLLL